MYIFAVHWSWIFSKSGHSGSTKLQCSNQKKKSTGVKFNFCISSTFLLSLLQKFRFNIFRNQKKDSFRGNYMRKYGMRNWGSLCSSFSSNLGGKSGFIISQITNIQFSLLKLEPNNFPLVVTKTIIMVITS